MGASSNSLAAILKQKLSLMNSSERTEFKEIVRGIDITRSKNACEDSLYEFVKQSWHIVEPATPLIENWHLETICAYMEAFYYKDITRLIICVPPGTMKSLLVSVFYPSWAWAKSPGYRFLGVANGEDLATRTRSGKNGSSNLSGSRTDGRYR